MVAVIREADRDLVSSVAKRHGISEQMIYTWRKRFGGFQADDVRASAPVACRCKPAQ
jgi:putative transposase